MAVMDKNNVRVFNNIGIAVIIFGLIMLGFLWNINSEIGKIRAEMKSEFGTLRAEMKSEFGKIHADIAEFRSESSGTEARLPNVEKGL